MKEPKVRLTSKLDKKQTVTKLKSNKKWSDKHKKRHIMVNNNYSLEIIINKYIKINNINNLRI